MSKTKVALLGTGFIANIHAESYARFVHDAEVVAVYGRDKAHAEAFAAAHGYPVALKRTDGGGAHGIPAAYGDIDELLAAEQVDVVDICLPNYLHHEACLKAAGANKHVIIEKPLALTLEQADEMIEACRSRGLKLMYAEELCFAPKYERVRALVEAGAVGDVYMLKQAEKHSGPHSRWFYQKETAGGGVMMDMGCHALAWFRWMNKNNPVKSVYADMKTVLHKETTDCDDNTVTLVEFENGVTCIAEDSWAKHGGMDDRIEVYGTKGMMETERFGDGITVYIEEKLCKGEKTTYMPEKFVDAELAKSSGVGGHNGSDFYATHFFIEKILGRPNGKYSIDVYQAVDMGICGILAFRSILNGNTPVDIPNLRNPEERDAWRGDNACTDPDIAGDQLLPVTSYPVAEIPDETYDRVRQLWLAGKDAE